MTPQEMFVTRLRRHRQRIGVSLEEIASCSRLKVEHLAALENNDLSAWPRGLYARAWIRAYARAVDLEPSDIVDEFCRLFPHGDRRSGSTIQEIAAIVASQSEYRDEFSHGEDRRRTGAGEPARRPAWHAPLSYAGRALWTRLAGVAAPRPRRAPRTTL